MSGFPTIPTARAMLDANLIASVGMPNGAQTVNSNLIDLNQINAFPVNEEFDFIITIPACANAANSSTFTITVVNNATSNTSNSANIGSLASIVVNGSGANGSPAYSTTVKIPGSALEFIGIQIAGIANGGNQVALTATGAVAV
jgi:hypothetical protein